MTKASNAIIDVLRRIEAKPAEHIDLYRIGIPLIVEAKDKFTEDEVYAGLMWLVSQKVIELSENNTLRLLKAGVSVLASHPTSDV